MWLRRIDLKHWLNLTQQYKSLPLVEFPDFTAKYRDDKTQMPVKNVGSAGLT